MSQKLIVRSFWSILLVVYFIVGYVRNAVFVQSDWAPDATFWDKFASIYLKGFILNIVPAFIIALVLGFLFHYYMTNRPQSVQKQTNKKNESYNVKRKK